MRRTLTTIYLAALALALWCPTPARAQTERLFPATGQRLGGPFLQFWQRHGGLAVFGYPISGEHQADGRTVQYVERQRFEWHPEDPAPYDVQLGRLGVEVLAALGVNWQDQPTASGPAAGCLFFETTRHNVCDQGNEPGFLAYWTSHGLEFDGEPTSKSFQENLALFGFPITEPFQYTNSSGDTVQAQWFERARFEWHPNNPPAHKVQLGRLGAELRLAEPATSAAVQRVVDYYAAINERLFADAYHMWANNGAASNQTFEQFTRGFANTIRVAIQLGEPQAQPGGAVHVPIAIRAVDDVTGGRPGQRVRQFRGMYIVQANATGTWQLRAATIVDASDAPLPPAELTSPTRVLQHYVDAINQRQYARAYTYWGDLGRASGRSFGDFRASLAATKGMTIDLGTPEIEGAAGSIYARVPVIVESTQMDRTQQTLCGTFILRRSNVPPFDQLGWHIERFAACN